MEMVDEKEIIKLFLNRGFQLSASASPLVCINPEMIISAIEKMQPRPFIITKKHVEEILGAKRPKPKIKITELPPVMKAMKIENYTMLLQTHYEKIKDILSKHMSLENLTSINKISDELQEFSTIAIVLDKKQNSLLVEDTTGEMNIFFDDELKEKFNEINLDDIIGLKCRKSRGNFYAVQVVYPDVPLSREVKKLEDELKILVISDPYKMTESGFGELISLVKRTKNLFSIFVFLHEKNEKYLNELLEYNPVFFSEKVGFGLSAANPALIDIEGLKILTLPKDFPSSINFISILKRRHSISLKPETTKIYDLATESLPDIVISDFGANEYKNYKGTTILSLADHNRAFLIDLKTREVVEEKI